MITSFTTDAQRAAETDRPSSILDTGDYIGVFRQVYTYETPNGAQMVCFNFQENGGQVAWIDLCITKVSGETTFGYNVLNAILLCAGLERVDAVPGKARTRRGEIIEAPRLKALEGRPIGLALQKEIDCYQDRTTGEMRDTFRMQIAKPFKAATGQTASEIVKGEEAKALEAFLKTLKDRDVRGKRTAQAAAPAAAGHTASAQTADEEIPF